MRIDKFLKISRLIKRRSVAKEVDKGRVQVNGNLAKSSSNVQIGDIVKIQFGNRTIELKVNALHESTKKEDAQEMYEIVSDERKI
ncbi:RNA-binding S4 domain-containing protein [Tetragenococcus halophilus]|nr:RNA-binding S4 domain-containing protein [Tetragenococcus halophilus]